MKLKKIASLALAGVMAVSMLAGCAGKTGTTENEGTTVTTSAIVDAIDDAQVANKVKVAFTYDSSLESYLKQASDILGNIYATNETSVTNALKGLIAKDFVDESDLLTEKSRPEAYGTPNGVLVKDKDGTEQTVLKVYVVKNNEALTEKAALKVAAEKINADLKDLAERTTNVPSGKKYYTYSYTGTVAMNTVTQRDGATAYVVVGTLTQAVTEK